MRKLLFYVFVISCNLTYSQDAWQRLNDFPLETRLHTSFTTSNYAYVLRNDLVGEVNQIFQYDISSDTWLEKNLFQEVAYGINQYGFTYNGDGYLMTGDPSLPSVHIYKYLEGSDSWELITSENFGDFGLYGYDGSVSVSGTKAYVVTPKGDSGNFRSYDFVTDTWESLADYPYFGAYDTRSISIGNKPYVIFWNDMFGGGLSRQLFEYDIENNLWIERESYPGLAGYSPLATFVIGDYIYVGIIIFGDDMHRFDTLTNSWEEIELAGYNGEIGASFSFDGKGYVLCGITQDVTGSYLLDDVWCLEPEFLSVKEPVVNEIIILPNPATESISISGIDSEVTYYVYDLNGRIITKGQTVNKSLQIEFLTNGVYILKLTSEEKITYKKFIKN